MQRFLSARRWTAGLIVAAVIAPAVSPAGAATATKRVVSREYVGFRGAAVGGSFVYPTVPSSPTIGFDAKARETAVSIEVSDASGAQVRAIVWYDATSDGFPEAEFEICGTSGRLRIPPRAHVGVDLFAGTCAEGGPSAPSTGVVRATFSSSGRG